MRRCSPSGRSSRIARRTGGQAARTRILERGTNSRVTKNARGSRSVSAVRPSSPGETSRSTPGRTGRTRAAHRDPAVRRVIAGRSPALRHATAGRNLVVRRPAIVGKSPVVRRLGIAGGNRSRSANARSGLTAIVRIDHRAIALVGRLAIVRVGLLVQVASPSEGARRAAGTSRSGVARLASSGRRARGGASRRDDRSPHLLQRQTTGDRRSVKVICQSNFRGVPSDPGDTSRPNRPKSGRGCWLRPFIW